VKRKSIRIQASAPKDCFFSAPPHLCVKMFRISSDKTKGFHKSHLWPGIAEPVHQNAGSGDPAFAIRMKAACPDATQSNLGIPFISGGMVLLLPFRLRECSRRPPSPAGWAEGFRPFGPEVDGFKYSLDLEPTLRSCRRGGNSVAPAPRRGATPLGLVTS